MIIYWDPLLTATTARLLPDGDKQGRKDNVMQAAGCVMIHEIEVAVLGAKSVSGPGPSVASMQITENDVITRSSSLVN